MKEVEMSGPLGIVTIIAAAAVAITFIVMCGGSPGQSINTGDCNEQCNGKVLEYTSKICKCVVENDGTE